MIAGLEDQREVLERAHEKVTDVNTLTGKAKSILRSIKRRAVTNKIVLATIIILLIVIKVLAVAIQLASGVRRAADSWWCSSGVLRPR